MNERAMSQRYLNFKWVENTSQFNEAINEDSYIGYFLEVDVQYLKNYM